MSTRTEFDECRIEHFIQIGDDSQVLAEWKALAQQLMRDHGDDNNPHDPARVIANRAIPSLIHCIEYLSVTLRQADAGARLMFTEMYHAAIAGGFKRCPPIPMLDGGCEDCCGDHDVMLCHLEWFIDKAAREQAKRDAEQAAKREQRDREEYERLKAKYAEGEGQ